MLTGNPGDKVWLIGGPDYTPEPIPARHAWASGARRPTASAPRRQGSQTLEFAYLPVWEKGAVPTRTVRYDVTVKSAGWENWF